MITEIIMAVQTGVFVWGLRNLNHMRKQEAIQSYTALSNRLFQQNLAELKDPVLFESLDSKDSEIQDIETKKKLKHYLFMQFTLYEQMFWLHESCDIKIMYPWCIRIFSLLRKKRMREYWENDYSEQSSSEFKEFVASCLKANSAKELIDILYKSKSTSFAKYCPFSSVCQE